MSDFTPAREPGRVRRVCCSPATPVLLSIAFALTALLTIEAYNRVHAPRAPDDPNPNGGVHRATFGFLSLLAALLFGIMGCTLVGRVFFPPGVKKNRCLARCGCGSFSPLYSSERLNLFTWMAGAWPHGLVPSESIICEAVGLFWLCSGFVVSACSGVWLAPAFYPRNSTAAALEDYLCDDTPVQPLFVMFFSLLQLTNTISKQVDDVNGVSHLGPLAWVCQRLGLRCRPSMRDFFITRLMSHWATVMVLSALFRTLRFVGIMVGTSQNVALIQQIGDIFILPSMAVTVFSFESSLMHKAFSRSTFVVLILGLILLNISSGLIPDQFVIRSFVFGVSCGYIVPVRLWIVVLNMESQRVGLLKNFLRYLSHEVRVPANVSLLAIDDIKNSLLTLARPRQRHSLAQTETTGVMFALPQQQQHGQQQAPFASSSDMRMEVHQFSPYNVTGAPSALEPQPDVSNASSDASEALTSAAVC